MSTPTARIYTRRDLALLHEEHKRRKHIDDKLTGFIVRIRKFAEEGATSCFIPDRQLTIDTSDDICLGGIYLEYVKGFRKIFPDSEVVIKENFDNMGRGIHIDWSI
jgi:hypothetical protein